MYSLKGNQWRLSFWANKRVCLVYPGNGRRSTVALQEEGGRTGETRGFTQSQRKPFSHPVLSVTVHGMDDLKTPHYFVQHSQQEFSFYIYFTETAGLIYTHTRAKFQARAKPELAIHLGKSSLTPCGSFLFHTRAHSRQKHTTPVKAISSCQSHKTSSHRKRQQHSTKRKPNSFWWMIVSSLHHVVPESKSRVPKAEELYFS